MKIVTGMHRSGTSFVCNLLQELGADFGPRDRLVAGDQWNERGYFENMDVISLNNALILGEWSRRMYDRVLTSNLPVNTRQRLRTLLNVPAFIRPSTRAVSRRRKRYDQEFQDVSESLTGRVTKDVRFCLTLDAWREYGQIDQVLFCYRHPLEVAGSLKRRQGIPLWKGLSLWRWHIRAFIRKADGLPVTMVFYENFFHQDSSVIEVERLLKFTGRECAVDSDQLLREILDPALKHHQCESTALQGHTSLLFEQLHQYYERHGANECWNAGE